MHAAFISSMKPNALLLLVTFQLLLTSTAPAASAERWWPQFRGPNASGVADDEKPCFEFSAGTNLIWKTEVPPGLSSPCIWGNLIFLTAAEGQDLVTLAVNREDGKVIWRQAIEVPRPRELHKKNHSAAATPATDGKAVCVFHATFGLVAYDMAGQELWRKPMSGMVARNGSGASPAMIEGRLILNCDVEEGKSFLAAYEPSSGKELWRTPRAGFISGYTTPVLWSYGNHQDLAISGSLKVVGYDFRDGRERWSIPGTEAVSVAPTPVVGDGQLYVMSRSFGGSKLPAFALLLLGTDKNVDGKISREEAPREFIEQGMFAGLDRNQDGFITDKEYDEALAVLGQADYGIFAIRSPGEGVLSTNQLAWKHRKGVAGVSSPLYYRGRVYVVQDGGRVTCYNAKSGEKYLEQERLGADGEYFSSPVAADGKIFFVSNRGVVSVIEAADTLKVLARNALEEPIMTTPAIVNDSLYVRSDHHLWAFGRGKGR